MIAPKTHGTEVQRYNKNKFIFKYGEHVKSSTPSRKEAAEIEKYKGDRYKTAWLNVGNKFLSIKYRTAHNVISLRTKRIAFEKDLQAFMNKTGLKQKER